VGVHSIRKKKPSKLRCSCLGKKKREMHFVEKQVSSQGGKGAKEKYSGVEKVIKESNWISLLKEGLGRVID